MARPTPTTCPCGLPAAYEDCCGRYHSGRSAAPTAEALMRSRYAAFTRKDAAYLLRTWHPDTRPPAVEFDPGLTWVGLEVLETADGSAFHQRGTVTYRARYKDDGRAGSLHERSRFVRVDGAWVYVDGDFIE
ncbi:YchJ family protein [Streptomyces sp. NPDC059524]|uniref:YchJ family protein n=1 Tax=Streptomyces sp. NPDC059524 TaxID=3346856 RepID=UPI0036945C9F